MKDQFRTEIKLKKGEYPEISYQSGIMLIGSCFSDEIGEKFRYFKFRTLSNPFGVTYNPISIARQIARICQKKYFSEADLFKKEQAFNSFELHGSFDRESKAGLVEELKVRIDEAHDFLSSASHLYITLGTSWVFELNRDGQIVNNCHKQPSNVFSKRLLKLDEIILACESMVHDCLSINKKLKIIFTISPVRHLKDGFAENSLSKSLLRISASQIEKHDAVFYFPSFEIMMDDLRDYRFYASDMLHPNHTAISYVWQQLMSIQLSEQSFFQMKEIEKIQSALNHKAFNSSSDAHQTFLKEILKASEKLQETSPEIDLKKEIQELKSRLTK